MTEEADRAELCRNADSLLKKAAALAAGKGELLFAALFGSTLYGTRVEGLSDIDVRGVYLPFEEPADAETAGARALHSSTAAGTLRNQAGDVDIDLYPLDRWLCCLLPMGDTGALDVLYAATNKSCVLFLHPALDIVFADRLRFLSLADGSVCLFYCLGQGNTYGLAGTRLGAVWRVRRALDKPGPKEKLGGWCSRLAELAMAPQYCRAEENGTLFLAGQ